MPIKLIILIITFCLGFTFVRTADAIVNPFSSFNNKFGIHILFPEELSQAADLVNSSGGDWGYVTIPIQSGDKDITKWQKFMDEAKRLHIIPIIRLATEGDYFNTKAWRKPTETDIIDFANFLSALDWPTKNRYIIVYNEVNRADEWGGTVNAEEYSKLLAFSINIFKSRSQDYFMINAGLDNAAPEQLPEYQSQYNYLRGMETAVPGIFNQIDGYSSHSYPNPGFSQPPTRVSPMSISSFTFERELLKSMSSKKLPVFITETGWTALAINDLERADFYQNAFKNAWSDLEIVAVTPFLLRANGAFQEFSFLDENGNPTPQYKMIKSLSKTKGTPALAKKPADLLKAQKSVLGIADDLLNVNKAEASTYKSYTNVPKPKNKYSPANLSMVALKWLIGN